MTPLPPRKTAKVNGRRWRIEVVEQVSDDDDLGMCDMSDRRITLKAGPPHQLQDTLFHELAHAACPSLDEDTIAEIERGIYAVLADNPTLRNWIFAKAGPE